MSRSNVSYASLYCVRSIAQLCRTVVASCSVDTASKVVTCCQESSASNVMSGFGGVGNVLTNIDPATPTNKVLPGCGVGAASKVMPSCQDASASKVVTSIGASSLVVNRGNHDYRGMKNS